MTGQNYGNLLLEQSHGKWKMIGEKGYQLVNFQDNFCFFHVGVFYQSFQDRQTEVFLIQAQEIFDIPWDLRHYLEEITQTNTWIKHIYILNGRWMLRWTWGIPRLHTPWSRPCSWLAIFEINYVEILGMISLYHYFLISFSV